MPTPNKREFLTDVKGEVAFPIAWECGCEQKKCGACAMVINDVPRLACSAFLGEIGNNNQIILEPLSKFPIVEDLIVDRSSMFIVLKNLKLWLEEEANISQWSHEAQYPSSRCIMCGCCLEICPNYKAGHWVL